MNQHANSLVVVGHAINDDDDLVLYIPSGLSSKYEDVIVNLKFRMDPLALQEI